MDSEQQEILDNSELKAPFVPIYEQLRNLESWKTTGNICTTCKREIISRFDSMACGCRVGIAYPS